MIHCFENFGLLHDIKILRITTERSEIHSMNIVPETTAETYNMQPTVTYLQEHNRSPNDMDEDENIIQENNPLSVQTSQSVQSCKQFQNKENSTNVAREIEIDLDAIEPNIQPENSNSDIGVSNVTTVIARYNINNAKELWSEDGTVNVMDYAIQDTKVFQPNTVCPSTNTGNKKNLKSTEITTALDSNQITLLDFDAVINSDIIADSQLSTSTNNFTKKNMETSVIDQGPLVPVVPHNNQHFSFEITASGAGNETGKPLTITINPIEIESKQNAETKDVAVTHGKK